ncbi:BgTH12-05049 [Blumeria graminis f. sp. triticale]|nr:BgTH12-05049 [Blumeria graminis f. sp. triticale]
MGSIKLVATSILLISFFTFVAFFGRLPQFRNTPIGWLYRLLWIRIPTALRYLDIKLTRGRLSPWVIKQAHHLWNDRHPVVLIFFMILLGASEVMFLPPAWPLLSTVRRCSAFIVVGLPWLFLYASAASDPGYITRSNHSQQMSLYPYNFAIFYPGQSCRTCLLLKPARSKHCSICKRCISKHDHHCIFINNCVGYGNYHFFLSLLASTAFLSTYATYVGLSILSDLVRIEIPNWSLRGKGYAWSQYFNTLAWALNQQMRIGAVTLLCLLTSPLILGLLSYHLYLIWAGMTTNESMKWSDLQADISDGYAFIRALPKDRQKDDRYEPLWTQWPKESDYILTRSHDGLPRHNIIGTGEWEPVWKLDNIENLYDLGLAQNLKDIFRPANSFKNSEHTG